METPPVQYVTTSDGYNIAYCVSGDGPPLVLMPEPFNHLHLMWKSPVYRSLWEPLASRYRLIQFDPRGMGLSQRGLKDGADSLDWLIDLEAVVDKLSLDRFTLYGPYFFGTVAAHFAFRRPNRVDALILWNVEVERPRELDVILKELRASSWDLFLETMARTFTPYEDTKAAIERMRAAWREADFRRQEFQGDVREMLRQLSVPVLVVARQTETLGLEEKGRDLAALIPNAQLVMFADLAGGRYTSDGTTPGLVAAIDDFLSSTRERHRPAGGALPAPLPTQGLSAREIEVLRLVAAGKSNAQIADELVISQNTVIRHVSNIFAKTGAANRAEATSYAHRQGLV